LFPITSAPYKGADYYDLFNYGYYGFNSLKRAYLRYYDRPHYLEKIKMQIKMRLDAEKILTSDEWQKLLIKLNDIMLKELNGDYLEDALPGEIFENYYLECALDITIDKYHSSETHITEFEPD